MNRILHQHRKMHEIPDLIRNIQDGKQGEIALLILTRLFRNGINGYIKNWFNKKEQVLMIELTFNTIIPNFETEYDNLTYHIWY